MHTNTFCEYRKKLLASPRVHLVFICDRLLIYLRSVQILLLGITTTQLRIVIFFKVKEIGKKGKHPERGDWDINGGGGEGD